MKKISMFATCPRGLEFVLYQEMRHAKFSKVEQQVGGVAFQGGLLDLYRANLTLRTAFRIFLQIHSFPCDTLAEFGEGVSEILWEQYMTLKNTFAISCKTHHPELNHSQYISLSLKDTIADYWRYKEGRRPSVDSKNPQVPFHIYLNTKRCTISLDSSFPSLYQRNYRKQSPKAPLNEALAAAMVLASDWNQKTPLIDPMCGSGTLLIEAALMAQQRPPRPINRAYAFQNWPNFREGLLDQAKDRVSPSPPKRKPPILLGFDIDKRVVAMAKVNAATAGVGHLIDFQVQDIGSLSLKNGWNGLIITNPPYGERLKDTKIFGLYQKIGNFLKDHPGYHAWVLTGYEQAEKALGLGETRMLSLKNGGLDCQLLQYQL